MDRFIEKFQMKLTAFSIYLKSNMDRFIAVRAATAATTIPIFKIQYG